MTSDQFPERSPRRFLRLADVTRMTSLRASALYTRVASGEFPQPLRLSPRCSVWLEHEVLAWMDRQPRGVGPKPGAKAPTAGELTRAARLR